MSTVRPKTDPLNIPGKEQAEQGEGDDNLVDIGLGGEGGENKVPSLDQETPLDSVVISDEVEEDISAPMPPNSKKHNIAQLGGQEVVRLVTAWTPTYLFGQVLPQIASPWVGILQMGAVPANFVLGDGLIALTSKPDPLSGPRSEGGGNVALGITKYVVVNAIAVGVTCMAGYWVGGLGQELSDRFVSGNISEQQLGWLLTAKGVAEPFLGTLGYLMFRGIRVIGMNAWECFLRPVEENLEGQVNLLQITGQYVIRVFDDMCLTEAALFYLNWTGQVILAADPRVQMGTFLAADCILHPGKYFAFTPQPVNALVKDAEKRLFWKREDASEVDEEGNPSKAVIAQEVGWRLLGQALFCGAAYGVAELAYCCASGDTSRLQDRAAIFTTAASLLVVDFAAREIAPRVMRYGYSLFAASSRCQPVNSAEEQTLDPAVKRKRT